MAKRDRWEQKGKGWGYIQVAGVSPLPRWAALQSAYRNP